MGNSELKPVQILVDEQLLWFQSIYSRYPKTNTSAKEVELKQKEIKYIQTVAYQIQIRNEIFAEITQTYTIKNQSNVIVDLSIPLYFIYQHKLILLSINTNFQNVDFKSSFKNISDFYEEPCLENFQDITNPETKLTYLLDPKEQIRVQLVYLQTFQIQQNELMVLSIPLVDYNSSISIKIHIETPLVASLTHKLINNGIKSYTTESSASQNFIMFCQSTHQPNVYIQRVVYGTQQYCESERYCVMMSMIPKIYKENPLEDFLYFNKQDEMVEKQIQTAQTPSSNRMSTLDTNDFVQSKQECLSTFTDLQSVHSISNRPRLISFFIDQSNSMIGMRMEVAKSALIIFIKSLPIETQYNIYSFGSSFTKLFKSHIKVSEDNIKFSIAEVEKFEGNMGSTFLYSALEDASNTICPLNYDILWFILTDGQIAERVKCLELIQKNNQINVFSLGVGYEFDKCMVEQLALYGRGSFCFCESVTSLIPSVIGLLHIGLTSRFQHFNFQGLTTKYVSQLFPNPQNTHLLQNQPLLYFCYFYPDILDAEQMDILISFNQESSEEVLTSKFTIDFKKAEKSEITGLINLYGISQMIEKMMFSIYSDSFDFQQLLKLNYQLKFAEIQKYCERHQYLNPLTVLHVNNQCFTQNIDYEKLLILSKQIKNSKSSITKFLLSPFTKPPTLRDQLIEKQELGFSLKQSNPFELIDSSTTQSDQQYMFKLILLQNADGSFPYQQVITMINPIVSPFNSLHSQLFSNQAQINSNYELEKKSINLPHFLLEKVWATALAIAFLKRYYSKRRGQWLIIFIKAKSFISQYLSHEMIIFHQATRIIENLSSSSMSNQLQQLYF